MVFVVIDTITVVVSVVTVVLLWWTSYPWKGTTGRFCGLRLLGWIYSSIRDFFLTLRIPGILNFLSNLNSIIVHFINIKPNGDRERCSLSTGDSV